MASCLTNNAVLLGLESITAYTSALSDSLVISNSVYIKSLNDIVPFEHFNIRQDS